jgi:ribosome-associated translation inhibitor RaiA
MIGRRRLFGTARAGVSPTLEPDVRDVRPEFPFALMVDPSVSEHVEARAASILAHVARFAPRPIVYARMVIREEHGPAVEHPATVGVTLDVSGRVVTARAAADTPLDALDHVERRLRRKLDRLGARQRARRRKAAAAAGSEQREPR